MKENEYFLCRREVQIALVVALVAVIFACQYWG